MISRHRNLDDRRQVDRINRTIAQFAYRLVVARDRSSEAHVQRYAGTSPTAAYRVRQIDKEIQIVWRNIFGPRPALSPFIDTPEKAARLEAKMAAEAVAAVEQADVEQGHTVRVSHNTTC